MPMLLTLLISGCSSSKVEAATPTKTSRDYNEFADLYLEWKNLFSPAKSQYFVYIYSISCSHCNTIKQDVLAFVNEYKDYCYLTEYTQDIKLSSNVSNTIGKEKVEEVFILGTPTLIEISDKHVAVNIAGEKDILNYIGLLPHNICS